MKTPKGEINDKVFELLKDDEILKKMEATDTPEACYDIAKDKIDIGFEDFKSSMSIGYEYLKERESGLLNEEDLDQVAGGKDTSGAVESGIGIGLGVIGAGIAAAGVVAGGVGAAAAAAAA